MFGPVVKDVFVDIVGDHQRVEFLRQLSDLLQFVTCEDAAVGIVRAIYDDRLGS